MRRAWWCGVLLACSGCFTAWDVGGPWACTEDGKCPNSLVCDDGVCCQPGANGSPSCPTLPGENGCPLGSTPAFFYRDLDGDGAGDPNDSRSFCRRPVKERWVVNAGDCNDTDVGIGPSAPERCNAVDDDCNGELDDGPGLPRIAWKRDVDGDGFGDDCATCSVLSCEKPPGFVERGGDCAPLDAGAFPGAPELCNGLDENCNDLPDDPPFANVENPAGGDGGVFPCSTGQGGVCEMGGTQCVFTAATGGYAPVCVPRTAATRDVCGNATDDDCNGNVDGRPGCGGPANLLTEPGVTIGALAFPLAASSGVGCLKGSAGGTGMGWLNPVWIGSNPVLHVWWAEAAPGQAWDLSTATSAYFPIQTSPINPANEGTWATDAGSFSNPVLVVCGPAGSVRYAPSGSARISTSLNLRITVPLRGGANWTVTGNAAAVLPEVTSVELWMSPQVPATGVVTFNNIMLSDAGTPGFR